MGQAEFDACIAAGGSAATCAVHLEGGDEIGDLSGLVGNVFGETSSGFIGILQPVKSGVTNRIVGYKLVNETGQSFKLTEGMQLGSTTGRSFDLGSFGNTGLPALVGITGTGSLTEAQFNRLTGGGTGTSGSAPSFASSKAAQDQAEAFRANQDRLSREFQANQDRIALEDRAEQNRLAEEAALKRGRLSTLTDLIQSFVGAQSQARDTLANLQPDPFRFAAVAGGAGPFGVTPQQGFATQLQDFASAPVPTADPNASLPSIQSAIQGLTGVQAPLNPQVFGAAGGAMIPAPAPGQSIAVKVGEKGEEILRVTAQGVEVIPLSGGMQAGGAIGFPFQPIEFDASTALPTFQRSGIFGGLGFDRVPTAQTGRKFGPTGQQRFQRGVFEGLPGRVGTSANPLGANPFQASTLNTLGIDPNLIRFGANKEVFFSDPRTGELRPFSGLEQFQQSGFDFGNVVSVRPEDRSQFQFGSTLGPGFDPAQVGDIGGTSLFADLRTPIFEPTTGTLLPNPSQVAGDLNRLRLTDPATFNLLLNAYENAVTGAGNSAGFSAANVLSVIQGGLSFGQERTLTGLR